MHISEMLAQSERKHRRLNAIDRAVHCIIALVYVTFFAFAGAMFAWLAANPDFVSLGTPVRYLSIGLALLCGGIAVFAFMKALDEAFYPPKSRMRITGTRTRN